MNLANVLFLPFQTRELFPEVLASADLALVSLLAGVGIGSLPSKTYSYLASGRAILAITDPGSELWQLIEDSQSGWCIKPGQPDELANTILNLVASPDLLQARGKNGREYVISHHSRQAAAQQFELLFQHIAAESTLKKGA
jgi:glycosyltransferase involved in cell wall biosynthesis